MTSFVGGIRTILESDITQRANIDVNNMTVNGATEYKGDIVIDNGSDLIFQRNDGNETNLKMFAGTADTSLNIQNSSGGGELKLRVDSLLVDNNAADAQAFQVRDDSGSPAYFTVDTLNSRVEVELPVRVVDGTAALPAVRFTSDPNSGVYSGGADVVAVSAGGADAMSFGAALNTSAHPVSVPDGAVGAPAVRFTSDPNSGVYSGGADVVAVSAGGADAATFGAANNVSSHPLQVPVGAVGANGLHLAGNAGTGLYSTAATKLQVAADGVSAFTFGEISNVINVSAHPLRVPQYVNAAAVPATAGVAGAIAYNTTDNALMFHNGSGWRQVTNSAAT